MTTQLQYPYRPSRRRAWQNLSDEKLIVRAIGQVNLEFHAHNASLRKSLCPSPRIAFASSERKSGARIVLECGRTAVEINVSSGFDIFWKRDTLLTHSIFHFLPRMWITRVRWRNLPHPTENAVIKVSA